MLDQRAPAGGQVPGRSALTGRTSRAGGAERPPRRRGSWRRRHDVSAAGDGSGRMVADAGTLRHPSPDDTRSQWNGGVPETATTRVSNIHIFVIVAHNGSQGATSKGTTQYMHFGFRSLWFVITTRSLTLTLNLTQP